MSTLREQLAAKARRRIVFHVEMTDPGEDRRLVEQAEQKVMLNAAVGKDGPEREKFEADLKAAQQKLAEHYLQISFQAATPADYEALSAAHFKGKTDDDIDTAVVLPALAAICAVDEELQDEVWWLETLSPATSTWSAGERSDLYNRLVELNLASPDVRIPKG